MKSTTAMIRPTTAVARWLAATVFLLSGLLKAVSSSQFAQTIVNYGFPRFQLMAPAIIVVEVLLSLLLIFKIRLKWSALFGAVLIFVFTLLYSYALIFKGITDCGCFGGLRVLNNNTVLFYVKNLVLLVLLLFLFWMGGDTVPQGKRAQWICVLAAVVAGAVGFQSGLTYDRVHYKKLPHPVALKDSPLSRFIETSPDSTYVVFAFSYTCPHCMNSVGNLKEYEALGAADRVIGLALGDSVARGFFFEAVQPNFTIHTHGAELLQLTRNFPRLYYIERDSIRYDQKGEAPAAYIFNLLAK